MKRALKRLRLASDQIAIFVIITVLAVLVLYFGGGDRADASIQNAKIAWNLSQLFIDQPSASFLEAVRQAVSAIGFRSAVLNLPLAILYSLFGVSALVTMSLPLIATFISFFLVYKIGQILRSSEFGLLAACLYMLIPINLYNATVYSLSTFLLLFSLLSIYLVIVPAPAVEPRRRMVTLVSAFIAAMVCFLLAEWGAWVIAFVVLVLLRDQKKWGRVALLAVLIIWAALLFHYVGLDNQNILTQRSPTVELLSMGGASTLVLFAMVGSLRLQQEDKHPFYFLVAWLLVSLLWLTPYYYNGVNEGFQLVLLPLVLLAAAFFVGIGLGRKKERSQIVLAGLLTLLLTALVVLHLNPVTELVPGLLGRVGPRSWQVQSPILTASVLIGGLVFYYLILVLLGSAILKVRLKPIFFAIAAGLLVAALVNPIYTEVIDPKNSSLDVADIIDTIASYEVSAPLFVEDARIADRLRYEQGFSSMSVEIINLDDFSEMPEDAYILAHSYPGSTPVDTWWFMEQFYAGGKSSFWLARKLSMRSAAVEYEAALKAKSEADLDWGPRLVGALLNLGRTCEAYSEWAQEVSGHTRRVAVIPIFGSECFEAQAEQENIAESIGQRQAWLSMPGRYILTDREGSAESDDYNFTITYHPHDSVFYDSSSLFTRRPIERDAYYLFTVRLSAEGLASPLYWRIGSQEGVSFVAIPLPEINEFSILMHVPKDLGQNQAYLSPALMGGQNTVLHVYDLRFEKIEVDRPGATQ